MSGALKVACAHCDWTNPIQIWTKEHALDVLRHHYQAAHVPTEEVVLHADDRGTITGREFVPPVMRLDAYPPTPDPDGPGQAPRIPTIGETRRSRPSWLHVHWARTSVQRGPHVLAVCRCRALRVYSRSPIGTDHTPIPHGWPAPEDGWQYEANVPSATTTAAHAARPATR